MMKYQFSVDRIRRLLREQQMIFDGANNSAVPRVWRPRKKRSMLLRRLKWEEWTPILPGRGKRSILSERWFSS